MNEEKIKEAYRDCDTIPEGTYEFFKAGYLALLNSLEPIFATTSVTKTELLYRLPEGVTK